jgi:hypothetical protein
MASTIKLKSGSGAPTSGQLVQGEPALDLTNKRLYTENASGTVIEVGTNPSSLTTASADINGGTIDGTVIGGSSAAAGSFTTISASGEIAANGGVAFGDNDKATFGASDDLQIYHDGAYSHIKDNGTGNLYIAGDNEIIITDSAENEYKARFTTNGSVQLYYDNAEKLATTSTGIDVTGTVTADGLSVQGTASATQLNILDDTAATVEASWTHTDGSGTSVINVGRNSTWGGELIIQTDTKNRANFASNGDISFYEDTGTTAKFFWDASAESLGIGQGVYSTTHALNLKGEGLAIKNDKNGSNNNWSTINNTDTGSSSNLSFSTGGKIDAVVFSHAGNVGIGTTSPLAKLHIIGDAKTSTGFYIGDATANNSGVILNESDTSKSISISADPANSGANTFLSFKTDGSERARLDASGNLLVGKTTSDVNTAGGELRSHGGIVGSRDGSWAAAFNRKTSDGEIVGFYKDGTTVGSIGNASSALYVAGGSSGVYLGTTGVAPTTGTGALVDNTRVLGTASYRWSTVYAATGTINTSDRNDKTEIVDISEAELRVAQACKGLMKRFKFKDAVETKGDNARYHFGIIAQDLAAAFEAEGLDASKYACFCSDTWTDEETGEERTRLGVRYEELLAFIIAAI